MEGEDNNHSTPLQSHLTVTLEHQTLSIQVGGTAPTLDVFILMCDMAKRALEDQKREQNALNLQQRMMEQKRLQQVADQVRARA